MKESHKMLFDLYWAFHRYWMEVGGTITRVLAEACTFTIQYTFGFYQNILSVECWAIKFIYGVKVENK